MGATSAFVWLICCLVITLGLVVVVVAFIVHRWRPRGSTISVPRWPDFAILDRGDQIHFVPLDEDGHVVDSGLCPCLPRRTANRRRSGRRVIYVDHQSLDRHSAVR